MIRREIDVSVKETFQLDGKTYNYWSLRKFAELNDVDIDSIPFTILIILEAALRHYDDKTITDEHIKQIINWDNQDDEVKKEVPFRVSRVLLQDYTGVPCITSLAAMRSKVEELGYDAQIINPSVPVDVVADHALATDNYGTRTSISINEEIDFKRNEERYTFLKWAQQAFENINVIPPGNGIVHQINLEYLATVVSMKDQGKYIDIFPDTLIGADSHTPMINGLGVLGWGVGGIEAEASMLGQPIYLQIPEVIGVNLIGKLPKSVTATDLVLKITEQLREADVVGRFVEFYGQGLSHMSLEDRATVANMAPEYGAITGYFPVDDEVINYLHRTNRDESLINLVEHYYKRQDLFNKSTTEKQYSKEIVVDLTTINSSVAGPKRPQDRVELADVKTSFNKNLISPINKGGFGLSKDEVGKSVAVPLGNKNEKVLTTGDIVLAAITSCTNTSNPSVMLTAGLVAKNAVENDLDIPWYVKCTMTPGSKVVTSYLQQTGLLQDLEALGFFIDGYGCATCVGNSGQLQEDVSATLDKHNMTVASITSGNRNFEGRIHHHVQANYLASPPLVVAYSLAGTMNIDILNEPLGFNKSGIPIYLKDIWPERDEINQLLRKVKRELFKEQYDGIYTSSDKWNSLQVIDKSYYEWGEQSTYIQRPPFFDHIKEQNKIKDIEGARVIVLAGDSVTTDHIAPGGKIESSSLAGKYLIEKGVNPINFNSLGSRRANHHIAARATFNNIRFRNELNPEYEGGYTTYFPTGDILPIYEAAMEYKKNNTPLIIIAGKDYGSGSSRDWAAKGPQLIGVKAVIAESFEHIHRNNLVGMGVLPLQFTKGINWKSLGIKGDERFNIIGLTNKIEPKQTLIVQIILDDGTVLRTEVLCRLDSDIEVEYYRNGGILQTVMRQMLEI